MASGEMSEAEFSNFLEAVLTPATAEEIFSLYAFFVGAAVVSGGLLPADFKAAERLNAATTPHGRESPAPADVARGEPDESRTAIRRDGTNVRKGGGPPSGAAGTPVRRSRSRRQVRTIPHAITRRSMDGSRSGRCGRAGTWSPAADPRYPASRGLAKRADGFRRRIPHLGVRAGKSHLINGLLRPDGPKSGALSFRSGFLLGIVWQHVRIIQYNAVKYEHFGRIKAHAVTGDS